MVALECFEITARILLMSEQTIFLHFPLRFHWEIFDLMRIISNEVAVRFFFSFLRDLFPHQVSFPNSEDVNQRKGSGEGYKHPLSY